MKKYTDIHVDLNVFTEDPKGVINKLRVLGFKSIAITCFKSKIDPILKDILKKSSLDLAFRIQLESRTRTDLLKKLRISRAKFEIIGVKCLNTEVARVAARDSRVDIISFPIENPSVRLSRKIANICNASVEINAREMVNAKLPRHAMLRRLKNEVECAVTNGLELIVSSGASSQLELLSPMDLASIPAVLGIGKNKSLEAVSENPYSIIRRNKMKLKGALISEGRVLS